MGHRIGRMLVSALLCLQLFGQAQAQVSVDTDQRDSSRLWPVRSNPEERINKRLWERQFDGFTVGSRNGMRSNYVLNHDGTVNVLVRVHPDVEPSQAVSALARHGSLRGKLTDHAWLMVVPSSSLRRLAGENVVHWVDVPPLPFLPESDRTRKVIGVDAVQGFDVASGRIHGLAGRGVRVGIFDWGIDETHADFAGRIIANDAPADMHATMIAGLIGGSGVMSDKTHSGGQPNGGSAYQWRGMAPLAELIDINQLPPLGRNGARAETHMYYITTFGMDVSNHSYAFSFDGAYDASNEIRDQLIRGDAIADGKPVPPRLHVTSAGNHGLEPKEGGVQTRYFSLTKQVKNALVVGNWDALTNRIAAESSLGPTHDGRIKPDLVAPGELVTSTASCHGRALDGYPVCMNLKAKPLRLARTRDGYAMLLLRGASYSAAVATGVVALTLEQYAESYSVDLDERPPLPSTLRGVLIHTATDKMGGPWHGNHPEGAVKATPGPDFVTGWGLINAELAVKTVADRLLLEDSLARTCDTVNYVFDVPAGLPTLRVTLAWDDVAADVKLAANPMNPMLVNDLDLVLTAPDGKTRHYPWQLDQEIRQARATSGELGDLIPATDQTCAAVIAVHRQFVPNLNLKLKAKEKHHDKIPKTGIPVAIKGPDHLNNVEVVDVPQAEITPGRWKATVSGFNVRQGPQRFSLIGQRFVFIPDAR